VGPDGAPVRPVGSFFAEVGVRREGEVMKSTRIRGVVAIAAMGLLTLSAAACGDDDDKGGEATTTTAASTADTSGATTAGSSGGDASSATEEDYVAAIEDQFTNGDGEQMSEEQATCVAPKWLDVITVDRLHEKDVSPDDIRTDANGDILASLGLSEADGKQMYDAFGACDISLRDEVVKSFGEQGELTSEQQDCLEDAFTEDLLERLFVAQTTKGAAALDEDEALAADFTNAIGKCAPQSTGG
jgi:hypothetical protein